MKTGSALLDPLEAVVSVELMDVLPNPREPTPASLLANARRELADQSMRGQGGRAAVERYAGRVDALLQRLCADAPAPAHAIAVVALGGYGRRHLCLHSDVDILLVVGGPIQAADERFLTAVLHPLWDLGLAVGHQVREVDEFATLERDNPEFFLALVDARPVAGDRALFERVIGLVRRWDTHAYLLDALQQLASQRHAPFNDTLYQLEPDVKDAPGGLRDLTALRTLGRITDPSWLGLTAADRARLDEAEDFLLRVRSVLHLEAKRNHNVLGHDLQEKAAEALGYPGSQPQQRVERLMGDYFRHARAVARALERARKMAPTPVGPNLVRSRDGIGFLDVQDAAVRPETWLDLFQAAIDLGEPVRDEALVWISQHISECAAEDFFPSASRRAAVVACLRPKPGLYARLSEMHDCGLLGRMFPEFQAIASRVVRDFYHKYTVDEHTLLTIRNLERLASPPTPSQARFASLLVDLPSPELLVLALLYHDVGKWRDDDHTVESVRMAQHMLARLDLPRESRDTVEFLIGNHLRMSIVAFRRDTEDPEVVKQLAALVGTEERLKMLCLLTLADVAAVSPETMTPWREELLWRLYIDTYNALTIGYGDDLIEQNVPGLAGLLANRPADVSDLEIGRFLAGLPKRYLQLFSEGAIYDHVRLSRDIHPDEVHVSLDRRDSVWELTVVTLDKAFLFSNLCGLLSSYGMDILRGHALTNPNGLVLDVFRFTDQDRFFELNPDSREQFLHELEDVVRGRSDITARLRARERGVLQRVVPRSVPTVHADSHSSARYTIVDIIASNTLGLLHRVSRLMSIHGCEVDLVLISTEGQKAIDVFHITKGGAKLAEDAQQALTADLQRLLEGHDEAD